jgi:hypothetical protein
MLSTFQASLLVGFIKYLCGLAQLIIAQCASINRCSLQVANRRILYFARDVNRLDWTQIKIFLNNLNFFDLFHGDLHAPHRIIKNFYHIINACIYIFLPLHCFKLPAKSCSAKYP